MKAKKATVLNICQLGISQNPHRHKSHMIAQNNPDTAKQISIRIVRAMKTNFLIELVDYY